MWQTIGQPEALSLFQRSLETDDLAHAYLFVGPNHVGKTTLAYDLARALNCQGIDRPCGECQPCCRILSGKHADVVVIGLDEVKPRLEIGIDDIRQVQRSVSLPPYEGRQKVFIINEAECLSPEASNCLLKILEEPPPWVIMLLLTAEDAHLLPTVVSRCQRVDLKPVAHADIERVLVELHGIDSDNARFLARLSRGCLGWALTVLADDSYLKQRDQRLQEMCTLLSAGWDRRFDYIAELMAGSGSVRKSMEAVIKLWLDWWHDVMLIKCGVKQAVINVDCIDILEDWAQTLSLVEVKDFVACLQESLIQISKNANLRLVLEVLMLDMPRKEKTGRAYARF